MDKDGFISLLRRECESEKENEKEMTMTMVTVMIYYWEREEIRGGRKKVKKGFLGIWTQKLRSDMKCFFFLLFLSTCIYF